MPRLSPTKTGNRPCSPSWAGWGLGAARNGGFICNLGSTGLACLGAGGGHFPGHREGPGAALRAAAGCSQAPSPCWGWHQPLCIPTRKFCALGAKAGPQLCSSLCFCSMRCKGPGGMRMGSREAGDAPAFLPHTRGRRGSWNCTQDDHSLAGEAGRAGPEQPTAARQALGPQLSSC